MTAGFAADVRRYADKYRRGAGFARLLLGSYGLQALLAYRLGRWLLRGGQRYYLWPVLPIGWALYYLMSRYVRIVFGIRIELSAEIGPGFYIGHFGAIRVIRCRIGAHCSIGRLTEITPAATGAGPVIGDHVWIGGHARIVGSYHIGSGATVGAGAVVQRDIPGKALCMGNPARVVMPNYDNRGIL